MNEAPSDNFATSDLQLSPRTLLKGEWPYLLILVLALFGIAYTSFSRTPMTLYWIVLAPLIGIICVVTRWPDTRDRGERLRLVWTQALHWTAVLLAMHLMFVADVSRMMNADASALAVLTLLALGTFTAGVHIASWRICLVGLIMSVGVPGIAWLEQSTLLLLLLALVVIAIIAPLVWRLRQGHKPNAGASPGRAQP